MTSQHPRHRSRPLLLAAALATVALPSLTRATPVSWSVDADGQWTTPSNWSTNALPTSTDDVTLDRPLGSYTITLSSGAQSINSLTSHENLSLTGGTLSLSSPSTVTGSFSLTGGTLTGPGSLTLAGPATFSSGALTGSGPLSLTNTASLTLLTDPSQPFAIGASSTRNIDNAGSINLSTGGHLGSNTSYGLPILHNLPGGSINKTGTDRASLGSAVNNDGSINVHQGSLSLILYGSGTGSINVDAGATFFTVGSTFASTVTGSGTVNFTHLGNTVNGSYSIPTTNINSFISESPISVTFNAPATLGTLAISSSSINTASATFNAPVSLHALTISGTATLSLRTGPLTWNYTGPSPIDTARQYLHDNHITSPSADPAHRLAYTDSGTSLTITLASTGDLNLDGTVNAADYALLDASYASSLPDAHWTDGDLNYDGTIDSSDYLLIDTTYAQSHPLTPSFLSHREIQFGPAYVSTLLASVPEPTSLSLLLLPTLLLSRRLRRT